VRVRAGQGGPRGEVCVFYAGARARSIMLNILGEADGEEGMARAHEVMARAYAVRAPARLRPAVRLRSSSNL
jgi:hypothetical protein